MLEFMNWVLIKLILIKLTPAQMFFCEYCEIFKNSFFYRRPLVAVFETSCMTEKTLASHTSSKSGCICIWSDLFSLIDEMMEWMSSAVISSFLPLNTRYNVTTLLEPQFSGHLKRVVIHFFIKLSGNLLIVTGIRTIRWYCPCYSGLKDIDFSKCLWIESVGLYFQEVMFKTHSPGCVL